MLQPPRSCLSLTFMLAGKSLPQARLTQGFRRITPGVCVLWQICSDSPLLGHDRQHIRLDMRLESRRQEGNERPCLPGTLALPLGASAKVDRGVIDGDNLTLSVRASLFMEWHHYEDLIAPAVTGYLLKL